LAVAWLLNTSPSAQLHPWQPHLFFGLDECFPVSASQQLLEGERLTILAADRSPVESGVGVIGPASREPGCARRFGRLESGAPSTIATVSLPDELKYEVLFAIPQREHLRIVAGPAADVSVADRVRLARVASVSLPAAWRSKDVLVRAHRFGSGAQSLVELYLGIPQLNPRGALPPVRSVQIRRFFMSGTVVLASDDYERSSSREERADTEPPQLTLDNWSESSTERTVAFLSEDEGRSWTRLSTDVGFEGIWWIAESLQPGLPRTSELFLYTEH
jgi:hypothetical protein